MRVIASYVTENVARAVFLAMSFIVVGAVAINALALQQGRHPAPFAMSWAHHENPRKDELASLLGADKAGPGPDQHAADPVLVKDIQRALAALGYYQGGVDGLVGSHTEAAIRAFQQAAGQEPTGKPSTSLLATIKLRGDQVARPGETAAAGDVTGIENPTPTGDDLANGDQVVARVQHILADLGYAPGPIDGKMGPSTRRALADFQRDRGLPATGKLTPGLIAELGSML